MQTYSTETTINREGELHLEHVPFHAGERVLVLIVPPDVDETKAVRQAEYDAFMRGYAPGDSIYDLPE